ncbi:MAG: class I SAM-dependent methyltransferase, partial [Bacteroidota bacterium]
YFDYLDLDKFSVQEIRRRYEEFFHLYKIQKNDKILEIGAGAGFALNHIDPNIHKYFPLDISTYNLKQVEEKIEGEIYSVSGDVFNLPFPSGSFDLILLSEVLEHLNDPLKALREIQRVLKPGGSFIVSVPYNEKIAYQMCIHCNKPTPTNAHLHSFDQTKLENLVKAAELSPIKISKCINKIANRIHFNLLTKALPFSVWKMFDKIFNRLIDKASSIIILAKK